MNYDGWTNLITNAGTAKDKKTYNQYNLSRMITWEELSQMYATGGVVSKLVDCVADDATRNGWYIKNDKKNKITQAMKDLGVQPKINEALKWSRLFGGSVILIGALDGENLDKPLNMKKVKGISYLYPFDRTEISVSTADLQKNPLLPGYMQAEHYTITPRSTGSSIRVHRSRILEFKGCSTPNRLNQGEWYYFGMSVIQKGIDELEQYGATLGGIATLMHEYCYGIYKFAGLAEALAEGNEDAIKTRLKIVDMSKSIINSVVLDVNESFERNTVSLAGVPEVIDRFMMAVASVFDIPVSRLFGRSAAGMNSTGDNDMRSYYDSVRSSQENKLFVPLQYIVDILNIEYKETEPTVQFNSLYQKTDKEELEEEKMQAEIDKLYIDSGVLDPEEVAKSRFGLGGFSYETSIQ